MRCDEFAFEIRKTKEIHISVHCWCGRMSVISTTEIIVLWANEEATIEGEEKTTKYYTRYAHRERF